MIIKKSEYDPDGWMFEDALHKARYIYPTPDNPNARTIEKHAIQIYDSELLERSMCEAYGNLRPLTYMNVQKYFSGNKKAQLLKEIMTGHQRQNQNMFQNTCTNLTIYFL